MEEYFYKKIDRDNIREIIPLFKNAFLKEITEAYLLKKIDTDEIGFPFTGYAAFSVKTNEAVSFYATYPCMVQYKDQVIPAAVAGDGMTHSDHQGKGLFVKLIQLVTEHNKQQGIKIVFGFPNEKSFPVFIKKLLWFHFEDLCVYLLRVKCLSWTRCKKMFRLPDSIFILNARLILSFFRKGVVPFSNSVTDSEYAGVIRNNEFFNYKTFEKSYILNIRGKSVWVKPRISYLQIGDMERCTESEFRRIIRRLKLMAFMMGIPYLRYHCSPGVYLEPFFKKAGRLHDIAYPIILCDLGAGIDMRKLKFTMCDNDTF